MPIAYYHHHRRMVTFVHSEKDIVLDDPRVAIIPLDVRKLGFDKCVAWLSTHDCMDAITPSSHFS